jgi:formylglycine-generating enzyme required for sulfatase activity
VDRLLTKHKSSKGEKTMKRNSLTVALVVLLAVFVSACGDDDSGSESSVCGDNVAEGEEICDGFDLDGNTCTTIGQGFTGGTLACNDTCDGWQTAGCTAAPTCGDDTVEGTETCDGSDLDGNDCTTIGQGFLGGTLACNDTCDGWQTAGCTAAPTCGDDTVEGTETCDGSDLDGNDCTTIGQGFSGGTLACNDTCDGWQTAACTTCGDDVVEGDEVCDDGQNGDPCDGCLDDCTTHTNSCGDTYVCGSEQCDDGQNGDPCDGCLDDCTTHTNSCGDGYICGSEVCDGSSLSGDTCVTQGFDGGTLGCLSDCSDFDTSVCWAYPGLTWVSITGGQFDMGSDAGGADELPVHTVNVPDFEMTETEVTVAQYAECVTAGTCSEPGTGTLCNWNDSGYEDHPVNCVDWYQAGEFCVWVAGRLPTEAEWEYAARSGGQDITYPWGDQTATCTYAVMDDGGNGCGTGRTMEVCSKTQGNTDQGLCDMAGNVWEWVEDDYHSDYNGAPNDGSAWVDDPRGSYRVNRGGSFYYDSAYTSRAAMRNVGDPSDVYLYNGFRCAR